MLNCSFIEIKNSYSVKTLLRERQTIYRRAICNTYTQQRTDNSIKDVQKRWIGTSQKRISKWSKAYKESSTSVVTIVITKVN